MKNFKKVLALVLAIATLLSFATVASAKTADFADAKDVKNVEAVDVLSSINVLEGYPADKSFKPAKNITREEAAKIIAIFANKSTDISRLYTSANPFADMKGRWGESYVAYGYRAGIIAGKNATSFVPKANVKGTEFLKMVLVVLGYDQNKESLVGSSWAVNTLELAKAKDLMNGLDNFDPNAALTRDQAAQIMLNALKAEKVVYCQTITNLVWDAKLGYWTVGNTTTAAAAVYVSPNGAQNNYNHELLAKDFNLKLTDSDNTWGQPVHTWTKGTTTIGTYRTLDTLLKTYQTSVTECQIAADCGIKTDKTFPTYVNGKVNETKETVQPTDTIGSFGAQGRLTEVYTDRIVMIDTFLAKVTDVKDAAFDAAGHQTANAVITLEVYDATTAHTVVLSQETNYGYAKGDYVLLNAVTKTGSRNDSGEVKTAAALINRKTVEEAAVYGEIVGKAESFEGAQTIIYYNANKHTVEGTTYDDALKFILGNGTTKTTKHTWFKDQYGNLIGVVEVATVYNYGVVTDMWWVMDGTNGSGKALANIRFMDDTTNTVTVSSIDLLKEKAYKPVADATAYGGSTNYNATMELQTPAYTIPVNYDAASNKKADNDNADIIDGHLFKINTKADGTVALTLVDHKEINDAKAHSEITAANVINKYPLIAGTAGTHSTTSSITVDVNTKILIATPVDAKGDFAIDGTYTYTLKTGVNEMPSFKTAAKVDYVLGADGVADYVYIIGELKEATTKDFVLFKGQSWSSTLKTDGNIEYNEVYIPVPAEDGSQATIKVRDGQENEASTASPKSSLLTDLLNAGKNVVDGKGTTGTLLYITYRNGYAVSAKEVTNTPDQYAGVGTDGRVVKLLEAKMPSGVDGKVLTGKVNTNTVAVFNVTEATEVIGKLAADMSDKTVYIIYNNKAVNYVDKIYVVDIDPNAQANPTDPWQAGATEDYKWRVTNEAATSGQVKGEIKVLSNTITVDQLVNKVTNAASASGSYTVTTVVNGVKNTTTYTIDTSASPATGADIVVADLLKNADNATLTITVTEGTLYKVVLG